MKLFRIYLEERVIRVSKGFGGDSKLMELDGVGFRLYFQSSQEKEGLITPEYIRSHLIMAERKECLIIADSKEEALDKCKKLYHEELSFGGVNEKAKVCIILYDELEEIPDCYRRTIEEGTLICDGFRICKFHGSDGASKCPIIYDIDARKYVYQLVDF